jgi:hypothetical protein
VIDLLDARIAPLHEELRPFAAADPRVLLLRTIPGIGELLGLTFAAEIGDVSRFGSPRKLIGYAGLAPRVSQSGDRSRTGALSKAGSRTLRWAAVEAAHQSWRPTNPWHELYTQLAARHGKNPAKSAVARKVLIATWHVRSRDEPFKPSRPRGATPASGKLPLLSGRLTTPHGIEKPRQLPRTLCAASAEREMSHHSDTNHTRPPPSLDSTPSNKENAIVAARPLLPRMQERGGGRLRAGGRLVRVPASTAAAQRARSVRPECRRCLRLARVGVPVSLTASFDPDRGAWPT